MYSNQNQIGEERVYLVYTSPPQPIAEEVGTGAQTEAKAGINGKGCFLAGSHGLLSMLCSTAQDHLPRGGPAHASNINQEEDPKAGHRPV